MRFKVNLPITLKVLKFSQIVLYLFFIFLWVRGNFREGDFGYPIFEAIRISPLVPLVPLVLVTVFRIVHRLHAKSVRTDLLRKKDIILVAILIATALSLRVPFLLHNFGLINADDGVALLMGKHISEGRSAPIYHYGQFYLGTFNYHLYGLVFRLFGYSVPSAIAVCLLIYLGFIAFQYFFFREMFSSRNMAFALAFFYCLPLGHMFSVSFHLMTSFPLVLLLGSLSLYLSYRVFMEKNDASASYLGFILGLLYWVHPSGIAFVLTAVIFVVLRFRMRLKAYIPFAGYAVMGGFPLILAEVGYGLLHVKFVLSGEKANIFKEKWIVAGENLIRLISWEGRFPTLIIAIFLVLGVIAILALSAKKKRFLPQNIFLVFLLIFAASYLFSGFSNPGVAAVRYLYPIYAVLPVFLLGVFSVFSGRARAVAAVVFLLVLFVFNNARTTRELYLGTKSAHIHLNDIISAMQETGKTYWTGGFWNTLLLTALSGENIVGWATDHEDYYPYGLRYLNDGINNNFVFFSEPGAYRVKHLEIISNIEEAGRMNMERGQNLAALLNHLGIHAKMEYVSENSLLIYGSSVSIPHHAAEFLIPPRIPELTFIKGEASSGHLHLVFGIVNAPEGYLFRLHTEIPGYSARVTHIPQGKDEVQLRIPHPPQTSFPLKFYLDYRGIQIPWTIQETVFCLPNYERGAPREKILLLRGVGPQTRISGKLMRICEKDVVVEINAGLPDSTVVRINLFSPIDFFHPFWYGQYHQSLKIELNGFFIKEDDLKPGKNTIEFSAPFSLFPECRYELKMKFRYHHIYPDHPFWRTAALLGKIEFVSIETDE